MNKIKYSVVIVSWNVKDLLIQSFKSFLNRDDVEIIIIDNNSNDGTVEKLRGDYPEVILIENNYNKGFAGANNQGFDLAKGEYVFILNPDTISDYSLLTGLGAYLDNHVSCGAIGPKIFYQNGALQRSCARRKPTLGSFFIMDVLRLKNVGVPVVKKFISKWTRYPYKYDQLQSVEAISGAAMLVRSSLLKQLNGFKEIYLHTGEDTDLCSRIVQLNYEIIYHPGYNLVHLAGQSSKQDLLPIWVKTYKSSFLYYRENYGQITANLFWVLLLGIKIPMDIFFYALTAFFMGKKKNNFYLNVALFKKLINS
jgi:GT2 family glycosyltransferase